MTYVTAFLSTCQYEIFASDVKKSENSLYFNFLRPISHKNMYWKFLQRGACAFLQQIRQSCLASKLGKHEVRGDYFMFYLMV